MEHEFERSWWEGFRNRILQWFGLGMALLLIGIALVIWWPKKQRISQLKISAGSVLGTRVKIAELLATSREIPFVDFEIVDSAGSSEALQKVDQGELDLAIVQGGLTAAGLPNVRHIASFHIEPLHLLVRDELHSQVSEHLLELKGKSVNLSTRGSGTNILSTELLSFMGLKADVDYQGTHYSYQELSQLENEQLPDAVFVISSLPSQVVSSLIKNHNYRLVDLRFAESFQLHWLDNAESPINKRRIVETSIPAFSYNVDPPRPPATVVTLGTRLELVGHALVSQKRITEICAAILEYGVGQIANDSLPASQIRGSSEFPMHAGTSMYFNQVQPVSTGRVIELTEQLIGILGATIGSLLFFWQWLRRGRERTRDREFAASVQRIVEIETSALRFEQDQSMTVDDLEKLQDELGSIKGNLIERYKDGQLEGADMLSAFLKHANDASELISRIVLHELQPKSKQVEANSD